MNEIIISTMQGSELGILLYLIISTIFFILSYVKGFELIGSFAVVIIGLLSLFNLDQFIISVFIVSTGIIRIFKTE